MLSIFSVLSETVATVSLSAPPTVANNVEQHMTLSSQRDARHWTNNAVRR